MLHVRIDLSVIIRSGSTLRDCVHQIPSIEKHHLWALVSVSDILNRQLLLIDSTGV